MGEGFTRAIKKFYPTESIRREKIRKSANEVVNVYEALRHSINQLHTQGIRFAVFEMQPDRDPPRIHVGMEACCDKGTKVTTLDRLEMETLITTLTKYKEVVWEA